MIAAIVCADENWAIGCNNELLVRIPEDMKFFKEKTSNNLIIMGRKTYDSINNKPLQNRTNCIITSKVNLIKHDSNDDCYFMDMRYVKEFLLPAFPKCLDVFIIGGGTIYKELLPYCEKIYLTKILNKYDNADTYFPNLENIPEWEIESVSEVKEYRDIKYQFYTYNRRDINGQNSNA